MDKTWVNHLSQIFLDGYDGFFKSEENPHKRYTLAYDVWESGFIEAREKSKEKGEA